MESVTKGTTDYHTSKAMRFLFVNLPPKSVDAIYSVLANAINGCKRYGLKTRFVTFDQRLYAKVVNMVAFSTRNNELSSVVVRLGDFHLKKISETENFREWKPLKRQIPFVTFRVNTLWFELHYIILHVFRELYMCFVNTSSVEQLSWFVYWPLLWVCLGSSAFQLK